MKRVFLFIIMIIPLTLSAQYWEAGIFMGGSNYNGDLIDKGRTVVLTETHFTYGGVVRYAITRRWAAKFGLYKGMISGSDQNAKENYNRRWDRNLSFQSKIMDVHGQIEFNILSYKSGHFRYKYAPYLFLGVGLVKFNPQAYYEGKWINLQPLGTEGQGIARYNDRRYKLTQVVIPFGLGWKQNIKRSFNLGLELSGRKTFTDYLDDISTTYVEDADLIRAHGQIAANLSNRTGEVGKRIEYTDTSPRGNPKNKDWYYFVGITLTYSFLPKICRTF
jgi:hypothetical protein